MIDCLFRLDFFLPFFTQILCGFFFLETRTSAFFLAVLFSFQRTIAPSDLNNIPHKNASVNNILFMFIAFHARVSCKMKSDT